MCMCNVWNEMANLYWGMGYPWAAQGSSTGSRAVAMTMGRESVMRGGTEERGSFTISLETVQRWN